MNGYTKIRFVSKRKSKSIDFSDLFSPPQTPKLPISKTIKEEEEDDLKSFKNTQTTLGSIPIQENEEKAVGDVGVGERFGEILSRNCSNSSQRFKGNEKQITRSTTSTTTTTTTTTSSASAIQAAVRRAFSMRRSCSVSEGYCRIYDKCDDNPMDDDDDDGHGHYGHGMDMKRRSKKKNKRGSKILKACKSLFGF